MTREAGAPVTALVAVPPDRVEVIATPSPFCVERRAVPAPPGMTMEAIIWRVGIPPGARVGCSPKPRLPNARVLASGESLA